MPHPFVSAYDVAVGPDGRVFVSGEFADSLEALHQETGGGFIVVFDPSNDAPSLFAETADPLSAIALGADGRLYAANWNNDNIRVFNTDGTLERTIVTGLLVEDDDSGVAGLAIGPGGLLYLTKPALSVLKVVDTTDNTVSVIDIDGTPWSVAVGANGIAYVTSFESTSVALITRNGTVFRTFDLGPGATPSDVTITPDRRVHVAYLTSEGGAIAVITAVAATTDTSTTTGPILAGVAAGAPVVTDDAIYQAVSGLDAVSGDPVVTVAVTGPLGTTTLVQVPGAQAGGLVWSPGGVVYQAVQHYDEATGSFRTGVLRVTRDGSSVFSGLVTGTPSGGIVTDGNDNAYLAVVSADSTTIIALSATGTPAVYTLPGTPGFVINTADQSPTTTINGVVYLTTIDFGDETELPTTYLSALGVDGGTTFSIDGVAGGPPVLTPGGTIVQAIARLGSADEIVDFTTVIAVLTGSGLIELPGTATGLPVGSPLVASDGKIYQTVVNLDEAASESYTTVLIIGDAGLAPVVEWLPGIPVDGSGALIPLVAGPNGVAYQGTYGTVDPATGEPSTLVAALTSSGIAFGGFLAGQPMGPPVAGIGGVVYQITYDAATDTSRLAVMTPSASQETSEFRGAQPDDTEILSKLL
ncbi:hypothetical protein [Mycolicibacterium phlei]